MFSIQMRRIRWSRFLVRYAAVLAGSLFFFFVLNHMRMVGASYSRFMDEVAGNFYSLGAVSTWALFACLYFVILPFASLTAASNGWIIDRFREFVDWIECAVVDSIGIIIAVESYSKGMQLAANAHALVFGLIMASLMWYSYATYSGYLFNSPRKGAACGFTVAVIFVACLFLGSRFGDWVVEVGLFCFGYAGISIALASAAVVTFRRLNAQR